MTFDDIMVLTSTVSGAAAFEIPECEAFFNVLSTLKSGDCVVEIGCQYGRSSSIIGQTPGLVVTFIDPWNEPEAENAYSSFMATMAKTGSSMRVLRNKSSEIPCSDIPDVIHLLHIDGDHSETGVLWDVARYVPRVPIGGFVCAHDYGRESLPGVYTVLKPIFEDDTTRWIKHQSAGVLGIWRRKSW